MEPSQLFAGRAFLSKQRKCKFPNHKHSDFIRKIIQDYNSSFMATDITDAVGDENYDSYIIEGFNPHPGSKIKLKYSLDENCQSLIRESDFLKKNKPIFTDKLLHSDSIKIGQNVRYSVHSVENADNIQDCGRHVILDNSQSFILIMLAFGRTECDFSFKKHFDLFFKEKSIENAPEFLLKYIDDLYGLKEVKSILSSLKAFAKNNYDDSVFESDEVCHGNLNMENILFRGNLFKFIDCSNCFKGNKILDIAFLSVNLGFKDREINEILKDYCFICDLDESLVREQFDKCLKVASAMVFTDIIYSYLIEYCVFFGSRNERILDLISRFSRSFYLLESFNMIPKYRDQIKEMLINPMVECQVDVEVPPDELLTKDKPISEFEMEKPKLNATLEKDENNKSFINIYWNKVNDHSEYLCYVIKPNGSIKQFDKSDKNRYIYKNLDVIGDYGIGVKTLGDNLKEDSKFCIVKLRVFDI